MMRQAAGLERAASAMLRVLSAGSARLVLTQTAAANTQSGLGIVAPAAAEVEMEPVLLQATPNGSALMAITTRGTVAKVLGGLDGEEAARALETSMLRADEKEYRIVSVTVKRFGGAELIYELGIEE